MKFEIKNTTPYTLVPPPNPETLECKSKKKKNTYTIYMRKITREIMAWVLLKVFNLYK